MTLKFTVSFHGCRSYFCMIIRQIDRQSLLLGYQN